VLVPSCRSCWSTNAPWDGAGSRMSHLASSSTHSVPTSSISTEEMMILIGYRQGREEAMGTKEDNCCGGRLQWYLITPIAAVVFDYGCDQTNRF
jgi:hypothetical protein